MADVIPDAVLNRQPLPRVLLYVDDESLREAFQKLEPRCGVLHSVKNLSALALSEWDVFITDQPHFSRITPQGMSHRYVSEIPPEILSIEMFGTSWGVSVADVLSDQPRKHISADVPIAVISTRRNVPGKEAAATVELDDRLSKLVRSNLLPVISRRHLQFGLTVEAHGAIASLMDDVDPLLVGPANILLGAHIKNPQGGDHWLLPDDVLRVEDWSNYIFDDWGKRYPATFPNSTSWHDAAEWKTQQERVLAAALESAELQRAEILRPIDESIEVLRARLADSKVTGDAVERRLLTAQSDVLATAVTESLQELGFVVSESDNGNEGNRVEDLQVTDPDDPAFIAAVEITGAKKGVKEEKVFRLNRHANVFTKNDAERRIPTQWLIANQHLGVAPSARHPLLSNATIEHFEEIGALAIDSPALFVMMQASRDGIDDGDIRSFIRELAGRLDSTKARLWVESQERSREGRV
jgi:hypothetical protein